ncbi:MAG: hypothetical protein HEQ22_15845 [Sphingopyxis sp.]|uniref:hypothetical protein n=1 Tax=Sphingopyxis sp. TaxID=1908224 RepID=UPI003D80FC7F
MTRYLLSAAVLVLAGCSGGEDKANSTAAKSDAAAPATPPPAAPTVPDSDGDAMARWEEDRGYEPDPSEPALTEAEPGIGSGDKTVPAAIRGRWALDASDCPKRPGTDLTALVIDATSLRFHESHGELARVRERDASRIVADYRFSGEGEEWNRLMLLDVADGGKMLIRRDYGEGAAANPMRYTRCTA